MRKNNEKDKKKKSPRKGRFSIEKDTLKGVLYAPFECVLMVYPSGVEPEVDGVGGHYVIQLHYGYI